MRLFLLFSVLAVISCGGGNSDKSTNDITLSGSILRIILNETSQLKATVTPADASDLGVQWSSNNPAIAAVDSEGLVTGVSKGFAEITATTSDGKRTAVCKVYVYASITRKIAYSKYDYVNKSSSIYLMDLNGASRNQITNSNADEYYSNPSPSPEGNRIVFESELSKQYSTIMIVDIDGTNKTDLTKNAITDIFYRDPAISPDGSRIVFCKNDYTNNTTSIWIMDITGNNPVKIANGGANETYSSPAWSPDGKKIIFECDYENKTTDIFYRNIYLMNSDGTSKVSLTKTAANGIHHLTPSFSPDGSKIVFGFFDANTVTGSIAIMNIDGKNQTVVSASGADETFSGPSWNSDGTKVLFLSEYETPSKTQSYGNIFIINSDSSGKTNLTNNTTNLFYYSIPHFVEIWN